MIIHSIKWRLQAWHGFLLVCLVTGLLSGFYAFAWREKIQVVDNKLTEAMTFLMPRQAPPNTGGPEGRRPLDRDPLRRLLDGGPPMFDEDGLPMWPEPPRPDGPRPAPPVGRNAQETEELLFGSGYMYYCVWNEAKERTAMSSNAPAQLAMPLRPGSDTPRVLRTRGDVRELINFIPNGRTLMVGTSLGQLQTEMHGLAITLTLIGLGIVVMGFAVGWWLASRALRPILEISRTAQDIAAGDLSQRINASETESELGQLAAVLNSTFARLDASFAQQRQFTSDAAHELRTPVSVILTQTQSTLNKERSGTEYRETLEACQRAAQRMKKLVESLLELARLDAGQSAGRSEPMDLYRCAAECVALVQPLAEGRKIQLHTDLARANCMGDPDQLALVITNLLSNAVHYNHEGGEVRIKTRMEGNCAVLTVSDSGPGIAAEHLPHIFDRFYRADTARTSSQGRTGLGLAITKGIVESHGGVIEVSSKLGEGTSFEVRLPSS